MSDYLRKKIRNKKRASHKRSVVDNAGVLETAFKGNELFEFKKASLKDNTGSMPITLYNELTKYLKEGKCYEIIDVRNI